MCSHSYTEHQKEARSKLMGARAKATDKSFNIFVSSSLVPSIVVVFLGVTACKKL